MTTPMLPSADLSIVIVNWNGGKLLNDCLASIVAHGGGLNLQGIVIDNASRDGSREMAERAFPQFQVINSGTNLGFGKANNLARSLVKSDFVLFLNPDTVLCENALERMVEFLRRNPNVGALGCKMLYPNGEVQELGLQYFPTPWKEFLHSLFMSTGTRQWLKRWLPYHDPNHSGYAIKLYGGCLLCRKQALERVGWFDERYFMYAEDVDLCRAIRDVGWKLYYLSEAKIVHVCGGASEKAPSGFSILMKSESIAKLIRKYQGGLGALLYRVGTLIAAIVRLLILTLMSVARLAARRPAHGELDAAFFKYRTLIGWALGVKRAQIAA